MRKLISSFLLQAAIRDSKVEGLAKKYAMSPENIRHFGDTIDPSPTGAYTEWIIKQYIARRGTLAYVWDGDKIKEALVVFTRLKNSPAFKAAGNSTDINTYKMPEFAEKMESIEKEELSKKEQKREVVREKAKYLREGCEFLGKVGKYHCYKVTTSEAATLMGTDTHWCTQSPVHSRRYLSAGPLYVFTVEKNESDPLSTPEFKNTYGSDKAYQFYFGNKIECQDAEGEDIGEQGAGDGIALIVPDDFMELFTFIAKFDDKVDGYIDNADIVPMSEVPHYDCKECGEQKMGNPKFNNSYGIFCSDRCLNTYRESLLEEEVTDLLAKDIDEEEIKQGIEELNTLVNSPDSSLFNFFRAIERLVQARHPVNPATGAAYQWPSNEEALKGVASDFILLLTANLEHFATVSDAMLAQHSLNKVDAEKALLELRKIEKSIPPGKAKIKSILEKLVKEITENPSTLTVRQLLERMGELPPAEPGAVTAHMSGWVAPDKTFVDIKKGKTASGRGYIEAFYSAERVKFKASRFTTETLNHLQGFLNKNAAWSGSRIIEVEAGNQFWEVTPSKFLAAKTPVDLR